MSELCKSFEICDERAWGSHGGAGDLHAVGSDHVKVAGIVYDADYCETCDRVGSAPDSAWLRIHDIVSFPAAAAPTGGKQHGGASRKRAQEWGH